MSVLKMRQKCVSSGSSSWARIHMREEVRLFSCLQLLLGRLYGLAAAIVSLERLGRVLGDVGDEVVELAAALVLDRAVLGALGHPEEGREALYLVGRRHVVGRRVEFHDLHVLVGEFFTYKRKKVLLVVIFFFQSKIGIF